MHIIHSSIDMNCIETGYSTRLSAIYIVELWKQSIILRHPYGTSNVALYIYM